MSTRRNDRLRLGQIGFGYWGPNLLRNFLALPGVDMVAVADVDPARLARVSEYRSDIATVADPQLLLTHRDVDAVVIATPARTHFALARAALEEGKHVLVEKPLALTTAEGATLIALAEEAGRILMTGHTFLYNPAVRRLKQYLDGGELGRVFYLYSQRLNLGRVRQDVNALWNFGAHDVSIVVYLLGQLPTHVLARGFAYLQEHIEDVVFMTLVFPGGVGAHIQISWLDPLRVRRTTVVGSRKMAVYDDANPEARLTLFDRRVDRIPTSDSPPEFHTFAEFQLLPRRGDVLVPAIEFPEPLRIECEHFVECIREHKRPLTDGRQGLDVVRVLEAAQRSLARGGNAEQVVVD